MPIKSFLARRSQRRTPFRRKSATAVTSRVVIRKPLSHRARLLWGTLAVAGTLVLGSGLFLAGQYSAGHASLESVLTERAQAAEIAHLRDQLADNERKLAEINTQWRIEQGARTTMETQVRKLDEERNRLSRDLAVFENLFPSAGPAGQPSVRGFRIEPASVGGSDGRWRYRLLIMRSGAADRFLGEIQLQVRYRLGGREVLAASPAQGRVNERLEFERYQRIEGEFQAPVGAKVLGATARVMENGRSVAESTTQP